MSTQTDHLPALPQGTLLNGRFRIHQLLGEGGFSLVYQVLDEQVNAYCVLKEYAPRSMVFRDEALQVHPYDENLAAQLALVWQSAEAEARILCDLTAKQVQGITAYHDAFYANGTYYMAMDQAKGMNLYDTAEHYRSQGEAFPSALAVSTLSSMLTILSAVHEAGYFQCDVKPDNIVIDHKTGKVTLIDFGAARTAADQHGAAVQVSPGYSPPEFYPSHRRQIGAWTDMYMLAACFYSVVMGGKLPEPADERAVRDRTARAGVDPKLLKLYPRNFLQGIDKALSLEPQDRFVSAAVWRQFFNTYTVTTQRAKKCAITADGKVNLSTTRAASLRRKPAESSSGGVFLWVIILALLGIGVWFFLQSQQ